MSMMAQPARMLDPPNGPLEDSIDLYLAPFDVGPNEDLIERYRAIMSDEERAHQSRFHFERDRTRYALTRALTRTCLSRYAAVNPADWRFHATDHGRPMVSNALEDQTLQMNISHTEYLVMFAVTKGRAIGVDIENKVRHPAPLDVANYFFAQTEVVDLHELPVSQRNDRFFEYWTLKEAYIKARGKGLSINLDSFYYDLVGSNGLRLTIANPSEDKAARWCIFQFKVGTEYIGAICAETGSRPLAVRAFETIPMVSCRPTQLTVMRSSAAPDTPMSSHQTYSC